MASPRVNITDRAKRYRAQGAVTGPRKCVMCGGRSDLQVMHLSGNEDHGEAANLAYGCRSCNGKLSAAFKRVGAGRPTNQYNPASRGVPTFGQYMWAVSQDSGHHAAGAAHDEAGAVIHATPKHKRIEYARRIVSKVQATKRERADERWNPAKRGQIVIYDGEKWKVIKRYQDGQVHLRSVRGDAEALVKESSLEASNPWPFSSRQAPISASGGILHHMAKAGKLKGAGSERAGESAGSYKGYSLGKTPGGEFYSSLDPQSWFETKRAAQQHIDRYLKGRTNPPKFDRCVKDVKAKGGAANAYAVCTAAGTKGKKRNPSAVAAEAFEDFHGYKPSEVITVTKKIHHHAHLAAAGELVSLEVWGIDKRGHKIAGFGGAVLAFNEDRNQLFVEGGDQTLNLRDFGIRSPHEFETLGKVTNIGYHTNKTHLGNEGGEAVYVHKFRSTNIGGRHVIVKIAREPDLIYDVRNEQLLFSGGSYEILREGINK